MNENRKKEKLVKFQKGAKKTDVERTKCCNDSNVCVHSNRNTYKQGVRTKTTISERRNETKWNEKVFLHTSNNRVYRQHNHENVGQKRRCGIIHQHHVIMVVSVTSTTNTANTTTATIAVVRFNRRLLKRTMSENKKKRNETKGKEITSPERKNCFVVTYNFVCFVCCIVVAVVMCVCECHSVCL